MSDEEETINDLEETLSKLSPEGIHQLFSQLQQMADTGPFQARGTTQNSSWHMNPPMSSSPRMAQGYGHPIMAGHPMTGEGEFPTLPGMENPMAAKAGRPWSNTSTDKEIKNLIEGFDQLSNSSKYVLIWKIQTGTIGQLPQERVPMPPWLDQPSDRQDLEELEEEILDLPLRKVIEFFQVL